MMWLTANKIANDGSFLSTKIVNILSNHYVELLVCTTKHVGWSANTMWLVHNHTCLRAIYMAYIGLILNFIKK